MKVFVAGGTGAIGTHAVREIVSAGHQVSVITRSDEKSALIRSLGASPISVSLFDRQGLKGILPGFDAVVNLATAIPPTSRFMQSRAWIENDRIRKEGSATLVDSALSSDVPRYIQESVSMLYRDAGNDWVDEGDATDRFPMAAGNHAAEANALRFTQQGRIGVVLRFGWFYGPGATHSEEFLELARHYGICIMMGPPDGYVSSIHMEDAGAAVAAALNVSAGTYNVVDDEPLSKRAYADALGKAVGKPPWLRAPGRLALLLGAKSTSLTRSLRVRNDKFKEASGWSPRYRSAREGWRATVERLGDP